MKMRLLSLKISVGAVLFCCSHANASQDQGLYWALSLKPVCDKHIEGFSLKSKDSYGSLRRRHTEAVAKFEANHKASSLPDNPAPTGQALEQIQSGCEAALDFVLNDGRPPDPRLATPSQTWDLFMSALRSGDTQMLSICFNPGDRPKYMQPFRAMTQAQLADLAKSFVSFDLTKVSTGDYQEGVVKTADGSIGLVLFIKSSRGWRISQL